MSVKTRVNDLERRAGGSGALYIFWESYDRQGVYTCNQAPFAAREWTDAEIDAHPATGTRVIVQLQWSAPKLIWAS